MYGAGPASAAGGTPVPMFIACRGELSPSGQPDQAVEPAGPGRRPGRGVLELLHRGEVRAVRGRQAGGVDPTQLAGAPERQQRRERRVHAEEGVRRDQLVLGDRDAGTGFVVDRVAVGDDQAHAVGGAAQGQHDQDAAGLAAGQPRRRCPSRRRR